MPRLFDVSSHSWTGQDADGVKVGKALLKVALDRIQRFAPSLCLFWATNGYYQQFEEILRGAWESLTDHYQKYYPHDDVSKHGWRCPLIGCSVNATIQDRAVCSEGIFVTVIASRYLRANAVVLPARDEAFWQAYLADVAHSDATYGPPERPVEKHWPDLKSKLDGLRKDSSRHGFLLSLLPGFIRGTKGDNPHPEYWDWQLLRLIRRAAGYETPIWGGGAGDSRCLPGKGYTQAETVVFCDGQVYPRSLVLAWVETKLKVGVSICSDYSALTRTVLRPTRLTDPGKLPGAESDSGKVVVEFNDLPAGDVFKGGRVDLGKDGAFESHETLLEYREPHTGEMTTAYPYDQGPEGVYFSQTLEREVPLRLVKVNPEELRKTAQLALDRAAARAGLGSEAKQFALVCSCRGRLSRFDVNEAEFLWDHAGDRLAGLAGWYGFGEIGMTRRGAATQRNWAMSALVLGDELEPRAMDRAKAGALEDFGQLMEETQQGQTAGAGTLSRALENRYERSRWDALAGKIAAVAGAVECSVFFRDDSAKEGRFVLAGTNVLEKLAWPNNGALTDIPPWLLYYRLGEGATGWVGKWGLTLNILRRDAKTLESQANVEDWPESPAFAYKMFLPKNSMAFLAVPVVSGEDVIGVLRLSSVSDKQAKAFFHLRDQYFLEACASFIATMRRGLMSCDLGPLIDHLMPAPLSVCHEIVSMSAGLKRLKNKAPDGSDDRSELEKICARMEDIDVIVRAVRGGPGLGPEQWVSLVDLAKSACKKKQRPDRKLRPVDERAHTLS